jgi:hypothetical protein
MSKPNNILELTSLSVAKHISPAHPSVLESLQQARSRLAEKVYPTLSRFYQDIQGQQETIFILGTWPSVDKHQEFLSNEQLKVEVLGEQEDDMSFEWSAHVPLWDNANGIETLNIIDGTLLGIHRLKIKAEDVEGFTTSLNSSLDLLEGSSRHRVLGGWNVDCEGKEIREWIFLTAWPGGTFAERESIYRECLVDLERKFIIDEVLRFAKDMESPQN